MAGEHLSAQTAYCRGEAVRTVSGDKTIKWVVVGIAMRWHEKTPDRNPGVEYTIRSMQNNYNGFQPVIAGVGASEISPWTEETK